ncbi:MAG: hypothetical protein ABIS51_16705 [Sphingomonas sp.]
MARIPYGNRRAGVLVNLAQAARLDLITEGLPIIASSAQSFWSASRLLEEGSREAVVLEGFAEEEAAKALILMDMVRCPTKHVSRRAGAIVKTFYDHLGRLIYADAQHWRPANLDMLRTYVNEAREGHRLEGYVGEYIVPNWTRYSRESRLYADIEVHEDGIPQWSTPSGCGTKSVFGRPPTAQCLVEAMAATGMFTRRGVQITHDIWNTLDFIDVQHFDDSRRLTRELFNRLDAEQLVTEKANHDHAADLLNHWQMPMYDFEFREVDVPLEVLEAEREANYWNEFGY